MCIKETGAVLSCIHSNVVMSLQRGIDEKGKLLQYTLGTLIFTVFSNAVILNLVIFIGPFKISTDHYHAVVDSALCACVVHKQDGFAH